MQGVFSRAVGSGPARAPLAAGVMSRFIVIRMRYRVLAFAVALSIFGCDSKKSTTDQPATPTKAGSAERRIAPLTDLTRASTLAPVRTAFNAKKGEARFLTLLSPT